MLVDLTPNYEEVDRRIAIAKEHDFKFVPQYKAQWKSGVGIYQCNVSFNFSHDEFEEFKGSPNIPFSQSYELFKPEYQKSQYGVADSVEQLKEYFKEEIEDPDRKFFLSCTPVWQDKENAGKGGGWRWHKWGEYIGKLDAQCEHLDDEEFGEDFKYIVCFHLYKLK